MLEINGVNKTFKGPDGDVPALKNVSLDVKPGELVAIQGRSGSGKTTLLLVAGGLLVPDSGSVKVGDAGLYSGDAGARARIRSREIGFVFQQFHLIPYLGVLDNIMAPALAGGAADGVEERARSLAERFGIAHRLRHVPGELSVGERQRTAMARALVNEPKLLLADEPTGNLDRENAEILMGHLKDFASGGGAVLLVTHDPVSLEFAARVLKIEDGVIEGGGEGG